MKDLVKQTQDKVAPYGKDFVSAIGLHILMAILGFVASRGVVFESLMPFGLVFIGGCSNVFLPSVTVGSFIGYFIPATSSGGFRYIAALLAIVAVRLLLSNYQRLCENPIFLSALALLSNATTGAVSYSGIPLDALLLAAECLIIFGGVFMTRRTFIALGKECAGLSLDGLICALGTMTILIIGVSRIFVFGLSVGNVLGVFLILAAAKYGGAAASCACGIAISFAAAVTGSFESGFGIYAFAGLAAGVFAGLGKYAQSVSVVAMG